MSNIEAISAAVEQDPFLFLWKEVRFLELFVTRIANNKQNEKPG